jgi:hypothetical protein
MVPPAIREEHRRHLMKRNQNPAGTTRRGEGITPRWAWRVLGAMAYAGAYIDPTGVLAVEHLRRLREGGE